MDIKINLHLSKILIKFGSMKLNTNQALHKLETLSAVATIPPLDFPVYSSVKRRFRTYNFQTNIKAIPFNRFILAAKYVGNIGTASRFMAAINGRERTKWQKFFGLNKMDSHTIGRLPINKTIGLWNKYNTDFQKCIDFLKEQQDLVVSTQKESLYDFSEFGLKQIVKFMGGGLKSEEEIYENAAVSTVMIDYRFKIKQTENFNYAQKQAQ